MWSLINALVIVSVHSHGIISDDLLGAIFDSVPTMQRGPDISPPKISTFSTDGANSAISFKNGLIAIADNTEKVKIIDATTNKEIHSISYHGHATEIELDANATRICVGLRGNTRIDNEFAAIYKLDMLQMGVYKEIKRSNRQYLTSCRFMDGINPNQVIIGISHIISGDSSRTGIEQAVLWDFEQDVAFKKMDLGIF